MKRYSLILGIAMGILIAEVWGGLFSNSLALLADAGHVLVDSCATVVAIIVAYCVKRGSSEVLTRKVGGYINAFFLGCISVWVFVEAIGRFQNPPEIVSWVMVSVAVFGTIGNYTQHQVIKSVSEHHVTQESMKFHIFSDLLQSIGVVFGGVLIWITGWVVVDPIISVAIALVMAWWTYKLFKGLFSGKYDDCHGHHHH